MLMDNNIEFEEQQEEENKPKANQAQQEQKPAPARPLNIQGAYKASDYTNLPVGGEVKELFKMIQR